MTRRVQLSLPVYYGENKGEHGGIHEAVIGVGNVAGPLLGMLGARLLGGPAGGMGLVPAVAALGGTAALAPAFLRARPASPTAA